MRDPLTFTPSLRLLCLEAIVLGLKMASKLVWQIWLGVAGCFQ